ncbi:MAG TPA: hypothetical protein VFC42_05905 [Methylomirabilota bacterium]|jgi:hypothetical protein|nr:hypothetical protein [Methylomirabilota bacterium]
MDTNIQRMQERSRQRGHEMTQVASRSMESVANWTETGQRLLFDLWNMSTDAARENLHLMTQLQVSTLELVTMPLSGWSQVQKELGDWYQRAVRSGMESMQRARTTLLEGDDITRGRGGEAREGVRGAGREMGRERGAEEGEEMSMPGGNGNGGSRAGRPRGSRRGRGRGGSRAGAA